MFKKLGVVVAGTALLAIAGGAERPVQVVTTNAVDYAGGTIRLTSTYGELNVETWDEPRVEVTATRTAFRNAGEKDQEQGKAYLNRIRVDVKKAANGDVEVTTRFPGRNRFMRAIRGLGDFNIDYRVKVPRNARLEIRHGVGDVVVTGVAGDIDAAVKSGDVVLQLPRDEKVAIDAKTALGTVYSDLDGKHGSSYLIGQKLTGGSGHTVRLRVAVGGISIQRIGTAATGE
jgi:hypothetical protein